MSARRTRREFKELLERRIRNKTNFELDVTVQQWLVSVFEYIEQLEQQSQTPESGYDVSQHHDAGA